MIHSSPHTPRCYNASGFTLIELSIVLVIIGLIVGGVLVGQDLIHAARLRTVMQDVNKYQTAIYTFKLKYNGLPGDLKNATTFFGADCVAGTGSGGPTDSNCDGDGDGWIITKINGVGREEINVFHHLGLAGLTPAYSGGVHNDNPVFGVASPKSSIPNAGFAIMRMGQEYNFRPPIPYAIRLYGGTFYGSGGPLEDALNGKDAHDIDLKHDDGKRKTGWIIADGLQPSGGGAGNRCASTGIWNGDDYPVLIPNINCHISFRTGE